MRTKHERPRLGTEAAAVGSDVLARNSTPVAPSHQAHSIEPLLGIAELAKVLNCSRRLVERMRSSGRLPKPTLMCGKCPRWSADVIRRWIGEDGRQ